MKKSTRYYTYLFITSLVLAPQKLFAVSGYQPLVDNLPGVTDATSLPDLLNGLFTITIAVAAVLAVIMIAVSGLEYMMSDIWTSKQEAKKRMFGAVGGLALILASVLILTTINPNLVNLDPFGGAPRISATPHQVPENAGPPDTPEENPGGNPDGTSCTGCFFSTCTEAKLGNAVEECCGGHPNSSQVSNARVVDGTNPENIQIECLLTV